MANNIKQHDLSFNETKVSFELLLQTAQIAVGCAKTNCERHLGAAQNASFASNFAALKYAARDLAQAARQLEIAADTLHVLEESKTRDEFTVLR